MAGWSTLPADLLLQIADSLHSPIDVLRLRSVCSFWRSTIKNKPRSLPDYFPVIPNTGLSTISRGFRLFKRTIYRFSIPLDPNNIEYAFDWIVKIAEDVNGKQLLIPLTGLPFSFSVKLDLLKIRVFEVGHEYFMKEINSRSLENSFDDLMVAFLHDRDFLEFEILSIEVDGSLAMFKSGHNMWELIKEMDYPSDAVIVFKGKFYAADVTGRLFRVESATNIEIVADSVDDGDFRFLIESCGSLLLVVILWNMDLAELLDDEVDDDDFENRVMRLLNEDGLRFKVYKLVESERKWEETHSLGDRILFCGENSSFSVLTSDIPGYEGNIIYIVLPRGGVDGGTSEFQRTIVAVYHLSSRKFESLTIESKHWELFRSSPGMLLSTKTG